MRLLVFRPLRPCTCHCAMSPRRRAGVAEPPGHHDRAVPGRRRRRHPRARRRARAERKLRQAVHRRQPRGRGRQSRRDGGRQGGCRRPYAAVRDAGADRAQQVHVQGPGLRLRAGFHAGRARRQVSADHRGDTRLSGEDAPRADRLCQTEPGQGQCRPSRQRHARTHYLGVDPAVCRRGDDARALPRLGAADHGPAVGTSRRRHGFHADLSAAGGRPARSARWR